MSELAELAEAAVAAALGAGAEQAEAYVSDSARREVRAHGGELESLAAAGRRGAGLRAWIGARTGYGFGTDLSPRGLAAIAARAVEAAQAADEDRFAGPPRPDAQPPRIEGLADPSVAAWPTSRVAELALAVERAALDADPRVAAVEQAVYVDSAERVAIRSSAGAGGEFESTSCYAYANVLAGEASGRETGLGFGLARGPAGIDAEAIGAEGAERATAAIGSSKPASRSCPVVLDPVVAAAFVGLLGGALTASAVQRGRSPLADRLGERVAAEAFVLHDDGLDPGGFATAPIDDEGVPRRRTALIEAGVLRSYLHDTYTARRGESASTGNAARSGYRSLPAVAPSNLVLAPGSHSFEQLLGEAGDGVMVSDVAGLHSGVNPVSGAFSVGATGRAIRGGEPAEPLREFTIAGELVGMLGAVRAAGAEPRWVPFGGSVSVPPLLVDELTIGGS